MGLIIICFTISYSHGELHNLHEFEQASASDDHFDGNEVHPTLHIDPVQNTDVNHKTSIQLMNKDRLSGHGQSLDDDTVSYYNRYAFAHRRLIHNSESDILCLIITYNLKLSVQYAK